MAVGSNTLTFTLLGKDKLGPVFDSAGGKVDKLGGKLKVAGLALVGLSVAAGTATVGLGKIEKIWGDATDAIIVGTGKQGNALRGLIKDFDAVAKTTPSDLQSVGQAIADLNARTGQSGPPLQDLARKLLNVSRLTKTDLKTNIALITRLFGDWSIKTKDQSGTLDKLFVASQTTGIGIDRLSELMVQFGSPLRQLGLGFEFTAAMFSRFEKEGVNIETSMPGLRMALKNFAKAGREPAPALLETMKAIRDTASTAEANTLAFKVFGVRAGPDLAAAIREGRFDLDALMATLGKSGGAIQRATEDTHGFTESWRMFKNRVLIVIGPLATKMFDKMAAGLDKIMPAFSTALSGLITTAAPIAGKLAVHAQKWAKTVSGWAPDVDLSAVTRKITTTASGWGTTFATQAKGWGKSIIAGVGIGLDTGDWSGLGRSVGNGIVTALKSAAQLAGKIGSVIGDLIGGVDWFRIGQGVGRQAPSFIVGFLDSFLDGIILVARTHPFEFALTLVSIIFAPARFLKPLVTVLRKIPIVGRLAAWLLTSLNSLGGPISRGIGFIGRSFMAGFRRIFPGIGEGFAKGLALLPTRLGVLAIDLQLKALRMMQGLAGAIGRGIFWVVAKIGQLIGLMLKPWVKSAGWLINAGKNLVIGLLKGILSVSRTVGGWIVTNVVRPVVSPFARAGSWLVNAGVNAVTGLKRGVLGVSGTIGRWMLDNVARPAIAPFANAVSWLWAGGVNLLVGLKRGILNQIKGIGGWINSNLVQPIINNVKLFFGIDSPSKVFAELGGHLAAGLFQGLSRADTGKAIVRIFGGMPQALGAIVNKGLVSLRRLPKKAMDALANVQGVNVPPGVLAGVGGLYRRTTFRGQPVNVRTARMLMAAEKILGAPLRIMQGSFQRASSFSGTTHTGGGVVDTNGPGGWARTVAALRAVGFAAWLRTPSQGPWGHHIHAVGKGDISASASAKRQVVNFGRGGDGLAGFRHGGWWKPGMIGINETSKPEAVFNQDQLRAMAGERIDYDRLINGLARVLREGRPVENHNHFPASSGAAAQEAADRLLAALEGR